MITALRVGKHYGRKRALEAVTFELARGGFLLVTGANGSGKTTLLRLCAGLAAPTAGTLDVRAARGEIGYVGHDPLVYRELTALENLILFARLYRVEAGVARVGMLLERFGLWDERGVRAGEFSRGMLQRLALCRALLHDPGLLLLDEPFNALDAAGAEVLDRELADLAGTRTFVVATHDPDRVSRHATARLAFA